LLAAAAGLGPRIFMRWLWRRGISGNSSQVESEDAMLSLFCPTLSPEKRRKDGAQSLLRCGVYFGEATLTRRMSWLPSSID
jgi:hypothetical protein